MTGPEELEHAVDDAAPKPCTRLVPPVWFFAALLVMGAAHTWLPGPVIVPWPWNLLGILPALTGACLAIAAWLQFWLRQTTVNPLGASSALVTDGVFGYTRNPMYLGMTLILAGAALGLGSLVPWVAVVPFPFWIHFCFVRAEERALSERFGGEFEAYRGRTRCWV